MDDRAALTRQLRAPRPDAPAGRPSHTVGEASPDIVAGDKPTVSHWIELADKRAFDRLSEDWARDVTVSRGGEVEEVVGLDAVVARLETYCVGMPDLRIDVEDVAGAGDVVFLRTSSRGTHTGELFGTPGTGRVVSYQGISTYYLADGKITHEWCNEDRFALMQAVDPVVDDSLSRAS